MKLLGLAASLSFAFAVAAPAIAGPMNEPAVLTAPSMVEQVQYLPKSGFHNPTANGAAVDWCATYATDCGAGGATLFCRQHGFATALHWTTFSPGQTFVLGSNQFCNGSFCTGFHFVRCGGGSSGASVVIVAPPAVGAAPPAAVTAPPTAAPPKSGTGQYSLTFITYAAFFTSNTQQPKPVDPQVFVSDSSSPAAKGLQNIQHVAGVRPAYIDQDAKTTALANANANPLLFDLGTWLGATGVVTISPSAGGQAKISAKFTKLLPGGYYSLFENHFDQQPVTFTPLDGAGKDNNFTASKSGSAQVNLTAPQMLTHANAVLLVYHSDKTFHGEQLGGIGVNAHYQLIARVPQ